MSPSPTTSRLDSRLLYSRPGISQARQSRTSSYGLCGTTAQKQSLHGRGSSMRACPARCSGPTARPRHIGSSVTDFSARSSNKRRRRTQEGFDPAGHSVEFGLVHWPRSACWNRGATPTPVAANMPFRCVLVPCHARSTKHTPYEPSGNARPIYFCRPRFADERRCMRRFLASWRSRADNLHGFGNVSFRCAITTTSTYSQILVAPIRALFATSAL